MLQFVNELYRKSKMCAKKILCWCFVFIALCIIVNCDLSTNAIKRKIDLYNLKNAANSPNPYQFVDTLRKQVQAKENELVKAEQVNKNFEKMIQLVNILGQVDSFLTERTRTMIKKLAVLADADDAAYEYDFKLKNKF